MFSIKFSKNKQENATKVNCEINTGLPVQTRIVILSTERGNQISAELLYRHLEDEYHNLIENAHRTAYEQGFKDGRQHRKKKDWFHRKFIEDNAPAH